jgi:hypothetical protein
MGWFDVNRKGLAKLFERRGKSFAIFELIQNAWDEDGVTEVSVALTPISGVPRARIVVTDNAPEGFKHIEHAYTLFAESVKKGDPTKRGRWNWGEKLVLSLCYDATIQTTKGVVTFTADGKRKFSSKGALDEGSIFYAQIRMTRDEIAEVDDRIGLLIPPPGIKTTYNGEPLTRRDVRKVLDGVKLPTLISDDGGNLKRTQRNTMVGVYAPLDGEEPHIYELGIPVCALEGGDKYHLDVQQKVPMSMERDNVTPGYLSTLRVHVMNEMYMDLTEEDTTNAWARDATSDERCEAEAVEKSLDLRFGRKRVMYDPSDPEANKLAVSKGYTVIHGRQLNKGEHSNVRTHELAQPAGRVTPSPKPYSNHPDADPVDVVERSNWSDEQRTAVRYVERLHMELVGSEVDVSIVNTSNGFVAAYGRAGCWRAGASLDLNVRRLGKRWFNRIAAGDLQTANELLIHEFGHHYSGDHLSSEYHDALCVLGAKLANLALRNPDFFAIGGGDE